MDHTINQSIFTVSVPKFDIKRFKGLVKLMGWTITSPEKTSEAKLHDPENGEFLNDETMRAIADSRNGENVKSYTSFDDFEKAMRAL